MTDRSLTLSAPAKVNLYLGVHTERDARGYHRVDSLMAAVGFSDTVTVTPAQALTVQIFPCKRIRRIGLRLLWPSIMVARQTSA